MKLYYMPGACSLSPHIVALEAGLPVQLIRVDGKTKRTENGDDFLQINPKGYVPTLQLDGGEVLTEGQAIVQYLADQRPESGLAPANGTLPRYHLQELLSYVSSELHKTYSPLFNPSTPAEVRQERKDYLRKRYATLDALLVKQDWLLGEHFTAADAYLFTVTNWAKHVDLDLSEFKGVTAFQQRVAARPKVQATLAAEGLLK